MEKTKYPDRIVGSDVILIDGLEPANIVVRVRNQMDIDFAIDDPLRGIILYILRFHTQKKSQQGCEEENRHRHRHS